MPMWSLYRHRLEIALVPSTCFYYNWRYSDKPSTKTAGSVFYQWIHWVKGHWKSTRSPRVDEIPHWALCAAEGVEFPHAEATTFRTWQRSSWTCTCKVYAPRSHHRSVLDFEVMVHVCYQMIGTWMEHDIIRHNENMYCWSRWKHMLFVTTWTLLLVILTHNLCSSFFGTWRLRSSQRPLHPITARQGRSGAKRLCAGEHRLAIKH